MAERTPPFNPVNPNAPERSGATGPEAKKILRDIVFEKIQKADGSLEYKSSDPSRKIAFLEKRSDFEPEPGTAYDVEILQDTNPANPREGKLIVRIVGQENVPIEIKKKERVRGTPLPIEVDREKEKVFVLETELPLNREGGPLVPRQERFRHFALDQHTLETIEKVATAVELREPCLLEGETSTSKTSSIEYLAMITGNEVVRFNLNGQTDTSELVGKFIPNDGELQIKFEELVSHPEGLKEESRAIVSRAKNEGRGLALIESQKIAQAEGLKISDWRWQDGLDVKAKKNGYWLILDEINLAEPQILERLNSQLEKNPSLTLSENGGVMLRELDEDEMERYKKGALPKTEPIHQNFRVFATMNPAEYTGRSPMSPAYKDRWTSYKFVESPTEKDYTAMLELMTYGEQPEVTIHGQKYRSEEAGSLFPTLTEISNFGGFLAKLAKFHSKVEDLARRREIGKDRKEKYIFTRRTLIEFMHYLENKTVIDRKTGKRLSIADIPEIIIARALQYYYLDKISDKDDLKKVKDQLDAVGISESNWTHKFGASEKKSAASAASAPASGVTRRGFRRPPSPSGGNIPEAQAGERFFKAAIVKAPPGMTKQVEVMELIRSLGISYKYPGEVLEGKEELKNLTAEQVVALTKGLKELGVEIEAKAVEERKFISLRGLEVEVTGEQQKFGYSVGDMLNMKPGKEQNVLREVLNAKKRQVVGFRNDGVVIQLDGDRVVTDVPGFINETYEKEVKGQTLRLASGITIETTGELQLGGYKVGDILKLKPGTALPELRTAKEIRVVGFTKEGMAVIQPDGGKCYMDPPSDIGRLFEKARGQFFELVGGGMVETTGELQLDGYKVGDIVEAWMTANISSELKAAKEIRVVGFTNEGMAVIQPDGGKCYVDPPSDMDRLFKKRR